MVARETTICNSVADVRAGKPHPPSISTSTYPPYIHIHIPRSAGVEQRQKEGNKVTCRSYPSAYTLLLLYLKVLCFQQNLFLFCVAFSAEMRFLLLHLQVSCEQRLHRDCIFKIILLHQEVQIFTVVHTKYSTTVNQNKLSLSERKLDGGNKKIYEVGALLHGCDRVYARLVTGGCSVREYINNPNY